MSSITQCFQPPLYWQQFEDLTESVFSNFYGDPKPTKFGRPGQAQDGVDVYGRDHDDRLIGIQCKRMDERDENNLPRPGGKILQKHLRGEIKEASKFRPKLDTWILATTAKRDANIQRYALGLDQKSRAAGSFRIQLWFWDDFTMELNRNYGLQRWYYDQVIHVQSTQDQDKIILEMLGEAFSRAAFRTPLHQETPTDFIQALKDTQHAISTGELKDRETRRVIRKAIGGRRAIENIQISRYLQAASKELQLLQDEFEESLGRGDILQSGLWLVIPGWLVTRLDARRESAITHVNAALQEASLQPI